MVIHQVLLVVVDVVMEVRRLQRNILVIVMEAKEQTTHLVAVVAVGANMVKEMDMLLVIVTSLVMMAANLLVVLVIKIVLKRLHITIEHMARGSVVAMEVSNQ